MRPNAQKRGPSGGLLNFGSELAALSCAATSVRSKRGNTSAQAFSASLKRSLNSSANKYYYHHLVQYMYLCAKQSLALLSDIHTRAAFVTDWLRRASAWLRASERGEWTTRVRQSTSAKNWCMIDDDGGGCSHDDDDVVMMWLCKALCFALMPTKWRAHSHPCTSHSSTK